MPSRLRPLRSSLPSDSGSMRRAGISLLPILMSLLLVGMTTITVVATIVALREIKARKTAEEDQAAAKRALQQMTEKISNDKLEGKPEDIRKQLLEPPLSYYQSFIQKNQGDMKMLPALGNAAFVLAGIQAAERTTQSVITLNQAMGFILRMQKEGIDPHTYPSMQAAFKIADPKDWTQVKGLSQRETMMHGFGFVTVLKLAQSTFGTLGQQNPDVVTFREDAAAASREIAKTMTLAGQFMPEMGKQAVVSWIDARNVLETLVRDQPANLKYKADLADACVAIGKQKKLAKENDAALEAFKRGAELREQLVAAQPDNEAYKKDLAAVQRDLKRIKPDEKPAAENAAAASAAPM